MPGSTLASQVASSASLRIFGFGLDFEQISQVLQIEASQTHRAGELNARRRPSVSDLWLLDSPLPLTEPMEAHIQWQRRIAAPHYGFLRGLKEGSQVRSYCGLTADDIGTFRVSAESLSLFTELAIDLEVGLVFLGPADSGDGVAQFGSTSKAEVEAPESPACRTNSKVAFQVSGTRLNLHGISAELGFEPSEVHHVGEKGAAGERYSTDLWSLAAPLPRRDTLDVHLRWLGMALRRHSDFLRSLTHEADLLIRCEFGTESDSGGVTVSPEGLKVCTQLDIPLEFDAFLAGVTGREM